MNKKALSWILFIILSLTWGSSFILMKKSMYPVQEGAVVLGPFQVGALRIVIAGIVLLPVAYKFRKYLLKKNILLLLVVGLFGSLMPALLFTLAETKIDSSLAGLLNMMTTFFVVLIGMIIFKKPPTPLQISGLCLGSVGLYFVLSNQFDIGANKDIRYALFLLPATLGYAISLTTIKFKLSHMPSSAITSLSFLLVLLPAILICFFLDVFGTIVRHEDGLLALGYVSILAIAGTAIAVLLFTKLISISNHIFSSAVAYMIPVVAIIFGLLMGEEFALVNIVWVMFIIVGVYLINRNRKLE